MNFFSISRFFCSKTLYTTPLYRTPRIVEHEPYRHNGHAKSANDELWEADVKGYFSPTGALFEAES
jgi:hypothetical protein